LTKIDGPDRATPSCGSRESRSLHNVTHSSLKKT